MLYHASTSMSHQNTYTSVAMELPMMNNINCTLN